ncbi:MAG: hypothetical protein HY652_15820 [Acidobacteria bacterium]|nr:hypothetical protein [Acidobacteriota bacterium]
MKLRLVCAFALLLASSTLDAQAPEDLAARVKALEERVGALEAELSALKAAQAAAPVPTTAPAVTTAPVPSGAPGGPSGQLPVYGGASALAKIFNPDTGIIGNFTGIAARNRLNPQPSLSLQESEVSLQAIVDPFARADFFMAFGEEGVEVEEGYVTFPALPGGFLAKAGKMRAAFGKTNELHNHSLPWIDRPLMAFNLLGGALEEADTGIKDAGLSISRTLPAPRDLFLEATAQIYRGDSGTLFQASRRRDIAFVGRLRGYQDLTESTNLELGGSYARGHNDLGGAFVTNVFGFDATVRWKPLRRAIYRSFIGRTEWTWSRREDPAATQRALGYFASLDYQLARRWFLGGRYDWSERGRSASEHDSGGSVVLAFWPSEFSGIRGQLRRTRYAEGSSANELLFQFLFTLGVHGAHPF